MSNGIQIHLDLDLESLQDKLLKDYISRSSGLSSSAVATPVMNNSLWLSPSRVSVHETLSKLRKFMNRGEVLLTPNIMTFDQFASNLLQQSRLSIFPVAPFEQRLILRNIVNRLSNEERLNALKPVARNAGFLDYLARLVADLKRDKLWPDYLLEKLGNTNVEQGYRELVLIYEQYQHRLIESERYDFQGQFWSAGELLQRNQRGKYGEVKYVYLEGYHDFTQSQIEIIMELSKWVKQIHIALPDYTTRNEEALFLRVRHTVESLQRAATDAGVNAEIIKNEKQNSSKATTGLQHVRDHLFSTTEALPYKKQTEITFVNVMGTEHEYSAIVTEIKQRLHAGVKPKQIIVVYRAEQPEMKKFCKYALQAGLPTKLPTERTNHTFHRLSRNQSSHFIRTQ